MTEKVVVAIVSAVVGGMFTWTLKAASIEGRLDGVERSLIRIEAKLK